MAINNSTYGTELDESYDTEVIKKYSDEIDFTYAKERIEPYIITSKAFLKRALNVKS